MFSQVSSKEITGHNKQLVDIFFPEFCNEKINRTENEVENDIFESKCHLCKHSGKCEICKATNKFIKQTTIEFFLDAHEKVVQSGKFNFEGCKIKVNYRMNFKSLRFLLNDYKDEQLCDLLEFGFPIGYLGDESILKECKRKELWKFKNHTGAEEHSDSMVDYLSKESENNAIIGPFKDNPFNKGMKISPLNSLPKKDTDERRVILDLSYPKGLSVNEFISNKEYLGEKIEVIYPKVDDFIHLIKIKGQGCLLFKKDLRRAYRQIPICPSSYNLVGFVWKKHIFCDTVLSMGCRSSAHIAQRVTNAITFIMFKLGIYILNYIDDLASAEKKENAEFAYLSLGAVLNLCGIEEAIKKSSPPSTSMTFIGVLFNTETMTIEVTEDRLNEIKWLLRTWLDREKATLKDIQSLLGKLNFVAACVRPGRIFISRMIKWLKVLYKENSKQHVIPDYVKKDILWWYRFLPTYNGISMMLYEQWSEPDEIFSSDACLDGCGGFWNGNYFHVSFPVSYVRQKFNINTLEMMSVIICLKLWGKEFRGKRIQVFCDNMAVCQVVNSGKAKCEMLQNGLREIAFLAATYECEIRTVHLESKDNRISDQLSRWNLHYSHKEMFFDLTKEYNLTEYKVSDDLFELLNKW